MIILGAKCQQTTPLKEEEEHQNSHSSSTIVDMCGVRVGNWVRQLIVATHAGHSLFQYECVSTNQNGMLLVMAAYITQ